MGEGEVRVVLSLRFRSQSQEGWKARRKGEKKKKRFRGERKIEEKKRRRKKAHLAQPQ